MLEAKKYKFFRKYKLVFGMKVKNFKFSKYIFHCQLLCLGDKQEYV
jgi:hypothetical protein